MTQINSIIKVNSHTKLARNLISIYGALNGYSHKNPVFTGFIAFSQVPSGIAFNK